MPSLFLELYSEEIPASLQKKAREDLLKIFNENLQKKEISYKSSISSALSMEDQPLNRDI